MIKITTSHGFTLLEGIIAITVISVGLTAALSLALSNLASSTGNEKRIVAANLAREGIELVRNQRDSNWLKMDLNKGTDGGANYAWDTFEDINGQPLRSFFVPRLDAATKEYVWLGINNQSGLNTIATCDGYDCISSCGGPFCKVFYDQTNKVYGSGNGGVISDFRRLLTMQSICYNDATNAESVIGLGSVCDASASERKVGILVTSIVRYDQAKKLDVVVKERLYNWR